MITIAEVCQRATVIPVLTVHDASQAAPLAQALVAGGLDVLEVTLRSDAALEVISRMREAVPDAIVGVGTLLEPLQIKQAVKAGAQFGVSPGLTPKLLDAAQDLPLLPGVATPSELMQGLEAGLEHFKFFPAAAAGGISMLKAFNGPFAQARFCPTGGIKPDNVKDYYSLANVDCVGGTWITPSPLIEANDWTAITELAQQACQQLA